MPEELSIDKLLMNACSNPSGIEGYNLYTIDLHCFIYEIVARPRGNGTFEILSYTGRST